MDDNLPAGYGDTLRYIEGLADEYEAALERAWERLEDAPDGVGWDVVDEGRGRNGEYLFTFRDGTGLEFETAVDLNPEPDVFDCWDWED